MASKNAPPPGDPQPRPSFESNAINVNMPTLPEWMDRAEMHGRMMILSLKPADASQPLPSNPFIIARSVEAACGKIDSANTEQRGASYVLKVRNANQAKKLMSLKELQDGTKINVIPHPTLSKVRCVVSCREVMNMDEKHLLEELVPQGVSEVRRITRKEGDKVANTPVLILTINSTVAPQHVMFGFIRVPTRIYYPSPMICFNCYSYGHTKRNCSISSPVCNNCSQNHNTENGMCDKPSYCKNCKGTHSPASKQCPTYQKEVNIIKIKTDNGLTFAEARKRYDQQFSENSYASVSGIQRRLKQTDDETAKDKLIAELKREIAEMKKVIQRNQEASNKVEKTNKREEVEKIRNKTEHHDRTLSVVQSRTSPERDNQEQPRNQAEGSKTIRLELPRLRTDLSPSGAKRSQNKDHTSSNDHEASSEDSENITRQSITAPPKAKRGRPRKNRS